MRRYFWGMVVFGGLTMFASAGRADTTCYTDCAERFPKWFQGADRSRCQVEKSWACLKPSGLPAAESLESFLPAREQYGRRILTDFLDRGYVISRDPAGRPMHEGDSLLWSAIAMASLRCEDAAPIRRALVSSVVNNGGRFLRIDPLPTNYVGNETSRDAEIGAMYGFALHSLRCPQFHDELARAWRVHYDFVTAHGKLHEGSNPNFLVNPALQFVWDLVSHHFLGTAKPSDESRKLFEAGTLLSTVTIQQRRTACYPVHLSTLLLVIAARLDQPVNELTRREFCHETRGMELPLTEWYCGRGDVARFLADFQPNIWEYRHQRCPAWERPDMDPGEAAPGVDFLSIFALATGR